jgi:PKHD-type hydroxylase
MDEDQFLGFAERLYYFVPTKLPKELLKSMKDYCDSRDYENALVGPEPGEGRYVEHIRRSDVAWINWDEWAPGIIHNMMISANNALFKYDLTHFDCQIQSTIYEGKGTYYNWHVDNNTPYERDGVLMERKLSSSLILSDPDEYEGGELEFSYYSRKFLRVKPDAGTMVVFPSWLPHRVKPLRSGKRRSLVAWMNGPIFK